MKRALITVATLGILASAGWVVEANAQANIDPNVYPRHMSERYGYRAPAYGPSRRYARRAYRRSARQTYGTPPGTYGGNLTYTPGSGPPPYDVQRSASANQPWEWHGAPGPNRRGNSALPTSTPCADMGTTRRAHPPKNERRSPLKPRPDAGLFLCRPLRTSPGGHLAWQV
jgi:hypothetical protein